jgi:acetoin utilization protein AcuC
LQSSLIKSDSLVKSFLLSRKTGKPRFMPDSGKKTAIFVGSDIFRGSGYGPGHPLNIPRVWPVMDICRALGWLEEGQFHHLSPASPQQLQLFHTAAYVSALLDAERDQTLDEARRQRHRIGIHPNPIYPEIYRRPATAAAGSLYAAEMLLSGQADIVFNPSGGTHHGLPDAANGFCFVNDPALALVDLLEGGAGRVAYVDIDAHHPDGVEAHLSSDQRLRLFSVHEANRWPGTGQPEDKGGGQARNFTLPRGAGDDRLLAVLDHHILPELAEFAPEILVIQAGADGLRDDPQSGLSYSIIGYWQAIRLLLGLGRPVLLLGGGGYNPFATARAWSGLWGIAAGHDPVHTELNSAARQVLESLEFPHRLNRQHPASWTERLSD